MAAPFFTLDSETLGVLDQNRLGYFVFKAGAFTLDDPDLGLLDVQPITGEGAGFVVGSSVSAGSVVGGQGFTGSASGSATSDGSVIGAVEYSGSVAGSAAQAGSVTGVAGFVGSVSGVGVSSGTVTGAEGNTGTVAGSVTSAGSVSGAVGFSGVVAGITTDTGSVSGSPALTGSVIGGSVSSGSVSGSSPQPPAPSEGGGRWYLPPAPLLRFVGFVRGLSRSSGSTVAGSFEASSSVVTVSRSDGFVTGFAEIVIPVVIPVRDSVAERQAAEEEILTLMGL